MSNMTIAIPASSTPQKMITGVSGTALPRCESMPITREPESALVMKKTDNISITTTEVTPLAGRASNIKNSMSCGDSAPPISATPSDCSFMAVPPEIAKARKHTMVGASSTTVTNSRSVRPRLIRAMKIPTKGVQEIHQAQ